MRKQRYHYNFDFFLFCFFTLILNGCTYDLWTSDSKPNSYNENISQLLISEDKKNIVVITERYHYIFANPIGLEQSLDSNFKSNLSAYFSDFTVKGDDIFGNVTLYLLRTSNSEQIEQSKSIGYKQINGDLLGLKIELTGKRYNSNKNTLNISNTALLSRTYKVNIIEDHNLSTEEKIKTTPLALVGDAIVLGSIPLFPIGYILKSVEEKLYKQKHSSIYKVKNP